MRTSSWILAMGLLVIGQVAQASAISIYQSDKRTTAASGGAGQSDNDNSITFGSVSLEAVKGTSVAGFESNRVDTGSGALLDHDIHLSYTGNELDAAEARDERLKFVALADTTYDLSGLFTVTDNSGPSRVDLFVNLRDLSTNTYLFFDRTESISTNSGSYVLGAAGDGDLSNNTFGNLTGSLISGHAYQLSFRYGIYGQSGSPQNSSATGCVTLSIGGATGAGTCGINAASVPAPATPLLFLLGFIALCASRRSKRD